MPRRSPSVSGDTHDVPPRVAADEGAPERDGDGVTSPVGDVDTGDLLAVVGGERTAEVVGWAQPLTHGRMSKDRARAALASALGLETEDVAGLSGDAVSRALDRLRELAEDWSRLAHAAERDELTGATRRGPGLDGLRRQISHTARLKMPLSVAFLDVDGLKAVNDFGGHAAGDRLLRDVVNSLHERLRSYDFVIRYGGDEFVVVLPGTDAQTAHRLLSSIDARLREHTGGHGVSIGVAELLVGESAADLVRRADEVLARDRRVARGRR